MRIWSVLNICMCKKFKGNSKTDEDVDTAAEVMTYYNKYKMLLE